MDSQSEQAQGVHPHGGQPLYTAGAALERADAAMLMVHGRGASAKDILVLAYEFTRTPPPHSPLPTASAAFAFVAPQAEGGTWYPYPFLAPMERNEPYLSSALRTLEETLASIAEDGIPPERTILLGFSQGACLALEFAARNARRYGGLVGLSGGLIGPDGTPRDYPGSLDGTPVFLGCSDIDPHIPKERVLETEEVLRALGGEVTAHLYPNMGHTVNADEIVAVREIMSRL